MSLSTTGAWRNDGTHFHAWGDGGGDYSALVVTVGGDYARVTLSTEGDCSDTYDAVRVISFTPTMRAELEEWELAEHYAGAYACDVDAWVGALDIDGDPITDRDYVILSYGEALVIHGMA